ncbi:hypothetical protein RQP46_006743 [Phenoliferia psychrophenolica]
METLNVRAGFLCNHEVLTLLQAQRDSRTKEVKLLSAAKQARVAKLGRKPYANEQEDEETHRLQPTELHTVTFECIKYLEESVHPIRRQTSSSISKLLKALKSYDLTKAERLSIVNLAPLDLVHIVVVASPPPPPSFLPSLTSSLSPPKTRWRSQATAKAHRRVDSHAPSKHTLRLHEGLPRRLSSLLTQLRTGRSHLRAHLFKTHVASDPLCDCGALETTAHFFLECTLYETERAHLRTEIAPDKLGLALLLSQRKHVRATLRFAIDSGRFPRFSGTTTTPPATREGGASVS